MSDTPLYDATLSEVLQKARREAELARARSTLAERRAAERAARAERDARLKVAEVERLAARRIAEAEQRAEHAQREARVRQGLVADEVEQRVRMALAEAAPPLPPLHIDLSDGEEPLEREAPPIPTMDELMRPSPGITRFLDSLLGPD